MTKYEEIKKSIETIRTNKIGDKFLSIKTFATHFKYPVDEVRAVVQDLISEDKLKFRKPLINEGLKTYDIEYLEVVNKRRIQPKDNSEFYG
jgi:hypothetical protein